MHASRARQSLFIAAIVLSLALAAGAADAQTLTILTTTLPNGTQGQAYVPPAGVPLLTLNGIPPVVWSVSAGALPPGLGLVTTLGVTTVTGTPTTQGTYNFTLKAVDALTQSGTQNYSVTINAPLAIQTTTIPAGQVGRAYSTTLVAGGGTTPYGWLVTAGSLPSGLSLNPVTGALTGTPTVAGPSTFTVQVTDSALATASMVYSTTVTTPPTFTVSGTETWTVDQAGFSLTVTGSGGQGALTWGTVTGVPTGLTASRTNDVLTVTGTPTATGDWTLRVTITDTALAATDLAQSIRINAPIDLTTTALVEATASRPWTQTLVATDGAPDHVWRLLGTPPAWMAIDGATGAISGTPPDASDVSVTVSVEGAAGSRDTRTFDLTVNPALAASDIVFPTAVPNTAYAETIPVSGGTAPITITLQSGALPPGLAFSGSELTGTPTTAGFYDTVLSISDAWGSSAIVNARITVARRGTIGAEIPRFDLTPSAQEAWIFDVLAGTKLKAKIKTTGAPADLGLRLIYTDGTEVNLGGHKTNGSSKVKIRDLILPKTGRVLLIIINASAAPVQVEAKVKGKASSGFTETRDFGPISGRMEAAFAVLPGSRVKVTVKAKGGDDVPPAEFIEFLGPDGNAVNVAGVFKLKSTGFKIGKITLALGGDHVVAFQPGAGTAPGTVKIKVSISRPDGYEFTYESAPGAALRAVPGSAFLLFRDEFEGEVSGLWILENARLLPHAEGAALVAMGPDGGISVSNASWNVSEAHVSLAGDSPIAVEVRNEDRAAVDIRLEPRRVSVFVADRLVAEAPVPAVRPEGRRLSLAREGSILAVAVDGVVRAEAALDVTVTGLAIRPLAGSTPVLESVILLGD